MFNSSPYFRNLRRRITSFVVLIAVVFITRLCPAPPTNQVSKIDQELGSATSAVNNTAVGAGGSAANAALTSLTSSGPKSQGLQFKDPVVSPSGTYRYYHDSSTPAGFGGNDWSGDISLDADIYDGLIAGVFYQYLNRHGHNSTGTTESLDSNSVSIYAAKRFIDLVNVGAAYNLSLTDHNLNGTAVADLDRLSNGGTVFAGVSDKLDAWFFSGTLSFTYAHDDYRSQPYLDTGLISLASEVDYDVTDFFTVGAALSYNYLVIQDTFPGVSRVDSDYVMIGPRFRFYPTDQLTVTLDLDTEQLYTSFDAYTVRLGCNYAF